MEEQDDTPQDESFTRIMRLSRDFYAYCTTHGVELDALHAAEGLDYLEIVGEEPLIA